MFFLEIIIPPYSLDDFGQLAPADWANAQHIHQVIFPLFLWLDNLHALFTGLAKGFILCQFGFGVDLAIPSRERFPIDEDVIFLVPLMGATHRHIDRVDLVNVKTDFLRQFSRGVHSIEQAFQLVTLFAIETTFQNIICHSCFLCGEFFRFGGAEKLAPITLSCFAKRGVPPKGEPPAATFALSHVVTKSHAFTA